MKKWLEKGSGFFFSTTKSKAVMDEENGVIKMDDTDEELFLPIQDRQVYEELEGNTLPGVTYRVNTMATKSLQLPGLPEEYKGLAYDMTQFNIGLTDGYLGVSPKQNLENLSESCELEKAMAYPLRINERIASNEAKRVALAEDIARRQSELEKLETEIAREEMSLGSLQEQREAFIKDEIAFEQSLIEHRRNEHLEIEKNDIQRRINEIEARFLEREREQLEKIEELQKNKDIEEEEETVRKHHPLAKLITGLLLVAGGAVFIIADIALSIAAIYALGFRDVTVDAGGDSVVIPWSEAIFDFAVWGTHWEGVFVCLGIAALTFFFKFLYERMIFDKIPIGLHEKYILIGLSVLTLITILFLGKIRADYLINEVVQANQAMAAQTNGTSGNTFLGVSQQDAFWGMFLTTLLFPMIGALMLSEGLNRMFRSLGRLNWVQVRDVMPGAKEKEAVFETRAYEPALPQRLDSEIKRREKNLVQLNDNRNKCQSALLRFRKESKQIECLIPVWREASAAYQGRWDKVLVLEKLLYIQGYEQGRLLRTNRGAYSIISGMLANELTAQPMSDNPALYSGAIRND